MKEVYLNLAESYLHLSRCYRIIAGMPGLVDEAARPYLELAGLNAELAASWATTARKHAGEARRLADSIPHKRLVNVCCN